MVCSVRATRHFGSWCSRIVGIPALSCPHHTEHWGRLDRRWAHIEYRRHGPIEPDDSHSQSYEDSTPTLFFRLRASADAIPCSAAAILISAAATLISAAATLISDSDAEGSAVATHWLRWPCCRIWICPAGSTNVGAPSFACRFRFRYRSTRRWMARRRCRARLGRPRGGGADHCAWGANDGGTREPARADLPRRRGVRRAERRRAAPGLRSGAPLRGQDHARDRAQGAAHRVPPSEREEHERLPAPAGHGTRIRR